MNETPPTPEKNIENDLIIEQIFENIIQESMLLCSPPLSSSFSKVFLIPQSIRSDIVFCVLSCARLLVYIILRAIL